MSEHTPTINTPPPPTQVPLVLVRAKESYKIWHTHIANLSRVDRHTIGAIIDTTFLSLLELIFRATFACDKFEKLSLVSQSIGKLDLLKFFLQLAWEQKTIDHKNYSKLIITLDEVGRMAGGWKKNIQEKTPAKK